MRIDRYLNCVNIVKRRTTAEDMCKNGIVSINGRMVKASKDVKVGDMITIIYLKRSVSYKVLMIPSTVKTVPKAAQHEYIKEFK